MNIINHYHFPKSVCVEQKLTKKVILEKNKLSSAEKKILNEVSSIHFRAQIQPSNYTISAFQTKEKDYQQILWVDIVLKTKLDTEKVNQFFQKLIPVPLICHFIYDDSVAFGFAKKLINQVDHTKRVLQEVETSDWAKYEDIQLFLQDLNCSTFEHQSLWAFYKSIVQRIQCLSLAQKKKTDYQRFDVYTIEQKRKQQQEQTERLLKIKTLQKQLKQTDSFSEKVSINQEIQKLKVVNNL